MPDCSVCIGGGDYDGPNEFENVEWPKARKPHRCETIRTAQSLRGRWVSGTGRISVPDFRYTP